VYRRFLWGVLALAAGYLAGSIGVGQEVQPRLELLNRAVAYLEQAGLSDEAAEVRKWIALQYETNLACPSAKTDDSPNATGDTPPDQVCKLSLLEQKLADFAALQAEIDQLRAEIGTVPQVVLRLRLLSFRPEKLADSGFSLVSIRHLLEHPGSVLIVEESSQVAGFLNLLEQQRLLQLVADPALLASPGRESVFDSRGNSAASHTHFRCMVELGDNSLKLNVRLRHAGVEIQAQPQMAPGQVAVMGGTRKPQGSKDAPDLGVLLMLTTELTSSTD
jgi:hypothetical protein